MGMNQVHRTRLLGHLMPGRRIVSGLAVCAAAGLLTCEPGATRRPVDDSDRLARALAVRRFEPRLSLTSVWVPCTLENQLVSGGCRDDALQVFPPEALQEAPVLRGEGHLAADPATLHRGGLWHLTRGDAAGYREAVSLLRLALDADSDNAKVWNDLAVAEFQLASETRSPVALIRALGAASQAERLAPDDPRLAFNRALILDRLHLVEPAVRAWADVIAVEGETEWGREARQRRERLTRRPPAVPDRQERRQLLEEAIGSWARAAQIGPPDGDRLAALRRDAEPLARETKDTVLQEAVEMVYLALSRDPVAFRNLAEGHAALSSGTEQIRRGIYAKSVDQLERARALLDGHGSPFAGWAELELLRCAYQRGDHEEVERLGRSILSRLQGTGATALRARTWWVLGTSRFARGELAVANVAFEESARDFAALNEPRNYNAVMSMNAGLLEWTGRLSEAWEARYAVLARLRDGSDPLRAHLVAIDAAHSAMDVGEPEASHLFADEAVRLAEELEDPVLLTNAYLQRAKLARRNGIDPVRDLELAGLEAGRIADPDRRTVLATQVESEQARSLLVEAPAVAMARLEVAIASFAGPGPDLLLPDLLVARARAERLEKAFAPAETTLRQALAILDEQRKRVKSSAERIRLADRADEVVDELIELELARGDRRSALEWASQSRGRELSVRGASTSALVGPPDPAVAAIVYRILPDRLISWCVRSGRMYTHAAAVTPERLQRLVRDTRFAIETDGSSAPMYLRRLGDLLLLPQQECIANATDLQVTPDGILHQTPFAALVSPDGEHLVETTAVAISPRPGSPPAAGRLPFERLLVVADPEFDRESHAGLPRLPGAAAEGSRIASSYREVRILSGPEATASALALAIPEADVLHVAAHAEENLGSPGESFLVLTPEPGRSGDLRIEEIADLVLSRLKVVVLAGCRTAEGVSSKSEGPIGLAWPFLAQGVPEVIATRWAVSDGASVELAADLHRGLAAGLSASQALRMAQRAALARNDPFSLWGAYTTFVSGAPSSVETHVAQNQGGG